MLKLPKKKWNNYAYELSALLDFLFALFASYHDHYAEACFWLLICVYFQILSVMERLDRVQEVEITIRKVP